jgi:hypothetical protein
MDALLVSHTHYNWYQEVGSHVGKGCRTGGAQGSFQHHAMADFFRIYSNGKLRKSEISVGPLYRGSADHLIRRNVSIDPQTVIRRLVCDGVHILKEYLSLKFALDTFT